MGVASEIFIHTPREGKHITGETIKGIVRFNLDKETVYKKISLSLVQKGFCQWYEFQNATTNTNQNSTRTVQGRRIVGNRVLYEGREKNVVEKIYFLNKDIDKDTTKLNVGMHEREFEITIPEDTPPTMKTDIGEIKYSLVLKFKKPKLFSFNKSFKTRITVYPRIDDSITDAPICVDLYKSLMKLFSSNNNEITIKAKLDKGYLTPGGEREISFEAVNNSDVIFSVRTELISKTKYKDDVMVNQLMFENPKTVKEVINYCTVETPSVPGHSIANMFNIIPVQPELCTVRHSKIIAREYKLKVTLVLPMPHINSSVDIPVFIGEKIRIGEEGEPSVPVEEPPSYWESMTEDKTKD